ncbi:MAG: gliding motility-associated ABC transporter permease subunit GldF [Bacteroidetes bacterium]|nr:gliding motility-associated ABC transporter permease subunit GldF [Bacteroidota bacterium]
MITIFKKEFFGFFNSLTAYVVVIVFLLINSLFLWILPGNLNILDYGYADLDGLFSIAPYTFMFLIPALTMRFFSEEHRSGTIELLLTKPISELHIILAKYFAALALVIFSIIPTLIYFYSVYQLGFPKGNLDFGAFWGSFTGLILLGATFVSIGIFSSVLTNNQILSFIVAVALSAFLYLGLDYISASESFNNLFLLIQNLGISSHYTSISRGVLDSRDLIYFLSIISLFIYFTKILLGRRKW